MSISASSVTLAAWSSSSVKSDAGWPGAGGVRRSDDFRRRGIAAARLWRQGQGD